MGQLCYRASMCHLVSIDHYCMECNCCQCRSNFCTSCYRVCICFKPCTCPLRRLCSWNDWNILSSCPSTGYNSVSTVTESNLARSWHKLADQCISCSLAYINHIERIGFIKFGNRGLYRLYRCRSLCRWGTGQGISRTLGYNCWRSNLTGTLSIDWQGHRVRSLAVDRSWSIDRDQK